MAETIESEITKTQAFWVRQIETYERKFGPWEKRGKKIIERYRDERDTGKASRKARFNILWSNTETLEPALYNAPPKPNVDRRWDREDDLGRYAALALERCATYFVNDQFDDAIKKVVKDRLLPGRGLAWVRYVPTFEDSPQIGEGEDDYDEPELASEEVCVEYVHWEDYGHTWAKTAEGIRGKWRAVDMDKSELKKRWPDKYKDIPLDDNENDPELSSKSRIYEIWDKRDKKAIWLNKSMQDIIEEIDDPLKLQGFFPCPEALYATLTNEDLIPTPDYAQYQDQAMELDSLTGRISSIQKALKVAGVYDGNAQGIDRLLSEGVENKLIPVDQWAVFGDKGLAGVMSFLPLEQIVACLVSMYEARDKIKQDIYELTGISDIIRGASDPNETLGAQELKGKYAGLRLDDKQKAVAGFCRSLVRIITEIIAEHFSLETIKQLSGVKLMTNAEKQQFSMQMEQQKAQAEQMAMQAQQAGQEPPPPPEIPEEIQEMMELPSWEDVGALIKNDKARSFRIDIETDSTIKTDQEADKQQRMEYITAMGGFLQQAIQVPPELRPLAAQMIMFASRGFKIGREFETELDATMNKIKKQAEQPQEQQPDPEVQKAQMEMQMREKEMQQEGQLKQMEAQANQQLEQQKAQVSIQTAIETEQIKQQGEAERLQMQLQADIQMEGVRQQAEDRRHAATLDNQAKIAASQPKETAE